MTTYQTCEIQYATTEEQHSIESPSMKNKKTIYGIATGCIAISLVIFFAASNRVVPNQVMEDVSMENVSIGRAKTTVRACTFGECYSSSCNAKVAPFTCLRHNGGTHGGCSPTEWTESTCDDQCSLEHCADISIPEDTASCAGVECGDDWCTTIGQTCGPSVPYQCTKGSSRFGCSANPLEWTLFSKDTVCSVCCDATTC